jgi:exonuclease III
MNLKILTWNVRGLHDQDKRLRIKNLLKEWHADVVCLQEIKMEVITGQFVRSLWRCRYVDWMFLRSNGASGGILLMWDKRLVEKLEDAVGFFSVSCKFKNVEDQKIWMFTGVYGPNDDRDRRLIWDELVGMRSWWEVPWVVGGDFNMVRFPLERVGSNTFSPAMHDFSDFISVHGLVDMPMSGGNFTWTNNREVSSMSRLDRFLFTSDWDEGFVNICQKRLIRLNSDHFPVLLECGVIRRERRPFRFENMWLRAEGFGDQVKSWWDSYSVTSTPSYVFAYKLKALKADLKIWNATEFGHISMQKQQLMAALREIDAMTDTRPLDVEEQGRREQTAIELDKVLLMEEISWRQKSRALWLKEGDKNSRFFHWVANSHRNVNTIGKLLINGISSTNQDEIRDHISQFYEQLYKENGSRRPMLDGIQFASISEEEAAWLDRPFEESEIVHVVQGCNGDKAPGPDGFSLAFFQQCWGVVRNDMLAVGYEFHEYCSFERSLNATFISLIPKKHGADEIKDFRPISLVGGMYKIIAKLLANRLSVVLGNIISPSQNAFVKGRQILDSVLIANECLDSRLKSKCPGCFMQAGLGEGLRSCFFFF